MQTVALRVHGKITLPFWAEMLITRKTAAESERLAAAVGVRVVTVANVSRDPDGTLYAGIVDTVYRVTRSGLVKVRR